MENGECKGCEGGGGGRQMVSEVVVADVSQGKVVAIVEVVDDGYGCDG